MWAICSLERGAADDGAALVFQDESLREIVSSRSGSTAYRVEVR